MNQTKPIRIIAVKKNTTHTKVKNQVPEYDANDIDIVVNMVNKAVMEKKRVKRAKVQRDRIMVLKLRERDVYRREHIVRQKEEKIRLVNTLLNVSLIGLSIIGMATAVWFCCFL